MVLSIYTFEIKLRLIYILFSVLAVFGVIVSYLNEIIYIFSETYCSYAKTNNFLFSEIYEFFILYLLVTSFCLIIWLIFYIWLNIFLYISSIIEKFYSTLLGYYFLLFVVFLILYAKIIKTLLTMFFIYFFEIGLEKSFSWRNINIEMRLLSIVKVYIFIYIIGLFFISTFILLFFLVYKKLMRLDNIRYIYFIVLLIFLIFLLPPDFLIQSVFILLVLLFYLSLSMFLFLVKEYKKLI